MYYESFRFKNKKKWLNNSFMGFTLGIAKKEKK